MNTPQAPEYNHVLESTQHANEKIDFMIAEINLKIKRAFQERDAALKELIKIIKENQQSIDAFQRRRSQTK